MVECLCVDPARVAEFWPHVRPLILKAIVKGDFSDFDPIERDVTSGRSLLWIIWDGKAILAAAVTELFGANGRKLCMIVACGGADRKRWLMMIERLEQFARDEGCAAMKIVGRKGWVRCLPDYRTTNVVLTKELH